MNDDPLAQLRDIHLPAPVSWWPPAIGWWLLLLLSCLCVVGGWWLWRRHQSALSKRVALSEWQRITQLQPAQQLVALSTLLRRCALVWYPRHEVAAIVGDAWLSFLDFSGNTNQFSQGPGQVLALGPYQCQPPTTSLQELQSLCQQWISSAYRNRKKHV